MTLRIPSTLKREIEALAERDQRSVNDWLVLRLVELVRTEKTRAETAPKTRK